MIASKLVTGLRHNSLHKGLSRRQRGTCIYVIWYETYAGGLHGGINISGIMGQDLEDNTRAVVTL